jgi:hypothetical protein
MLFESMNEIVWSLIVLLLGGSLAVVLGRGIGVRPAMAALLYLWHSWWGAFYAAYILINGGDAFSYFERARFDFVEPWFGTQFVIWITSFATSIGLGFWPISLIYNLAGAIGLVFFYAAIREAVGSEARGFIGKALIFVCAFLPSLSFWTSGLGKDSIAFLSVGLFLWAASAFDRRQVGAIISVLVMIAVRPHIAVLMVVSVGVGIIFVKDLRATVRFGMGAISTAAAAFVVPITLLYVGTGRFSSITEYITDRQEHNTGGGSSIDITGMNPLFRFLSFVYRPLPNEASGFSQLAASADNLILIALTALGIAAIYRAGFVRVFRTHSITLLYGLGCLLLLSQVTANLGLAMRQKWMAVPALILVFVAAWATARQDAAKKRRAQYRLVAAPAPALPPQAVR